MSEPIALEFSGDCWNNPLQFQTQLDQVPLGESVFLDMRSEGPCLQALGVTEVIDSWLHDRGFEPYTQDFRDISDLDLVEPHNLPEFLRVLCQQTPTYWQKKLVDLQEKILYNKAHFAEYVAQQKSLVQKGIPCPI